MTHTSDEIEHKGFIKGVAWAASLVKSMEGAEGEDILTESGISPRDFIKHAPEVDVNNFKEWMLL